MVGENGRAEFDGNRELSTPPFPKSAGEGAVLWRGLTPERVIFWYKIYLFILPSGYLGEFDARWGIVADDCALGNTCSTEWNYELRTSRSYLAKFGGFR